MNRLLISAAHKSSGKTTATLGLCAALRERGHTVQPFKKGPDYIDPMWLTLAADRPCHNLDFFLMSQPEIERTFITRSAGADVALIEGNKGLYDGLSLDGSNSNAALARLLNTPIVLVIDARGMTRGIAPLILGYQAFEQDIHIAGVILNQLGGSRHETKLRAVIEHYTKIPVLGALHFDPRLSIVERHLGLVPSNEATAARKQIETIAQRVAAGVDLARLEQVAASAPLLPRLVTPAADDRPSLAQRPDTSPVRIGVARDAAFAFYYPGDLEALEQAGAQLVFFDTLHDRQLPNVDGLFIGGGFPETQMAHLETNSDLRMALRAAIEAGMPVYAECGGLMYLSRGISWKGRRHEMVGAIPADTIMHERPQGRGYVVLRETGVHPWGIGNTPGDIHAHEFHYSTLADIDPNLRYAYDVQRGSGIDGRRDGLVHRNVLACYSHLRHVDANPWTTRFVNFVQHHRQPATASRRAAT